jgi:hypothetical protein
MEYAASGAPESSLINVPLWITGFGCPAPCIRLFSPPKTAELVGLAEGLAT